MMNKVIVLGSINMDVVVTAPRHPELGETIFGDGLHFIPGGKGANQAVAAGRLGGRVQLVGRLGQDAFGNSLQAFLDGESLDLTYLARVEDAPTGTALITVNSHSENTIVVISGANQRITVEDVADVPLGAEDVVVSQFEVPQPALKALFRRAHTAGAKTVLNPAPASAFTDGLLPLIDYLIVNETELAYLSSSPLTDDETQLTAQARSLRHSPQQTIIVTLGAAGVLCIAGDETLRVAGRQVKAVDTTGAGDCFVGAFAVATGEGQPLQAALEFANLAASVSVQKLGAAVSLPYRSQLNGG
jgi:ribokinase